MTIQDIALFNALGAKMGYLNQRQNVIAQNIANSDTPGYRPQDLVKTDFSKLLKDDKKAVDVQSVHLASPDGGQLNVQSKKQKETYEVAPAGNAVIMEEQMFNSGQNVTDYNLMINIYQKQVGMFKTALGSR
jgi:flagellar basal-body rod protein FlgB